MATLSNTGAELFAVGTVGDDVTWISLWSASTGGTYYGRIQVTGNPAALASGERFRIAAGDLDLIFTAGGNLTNALMKAVLDAVAAGTFSVFVQLHDGDPGANGTASVISGTARINITSWSATT